MQSKRCACCGKAFHPRPQTPKQTFCPAQPCQRERRRLWQQAKRESDADYRQNQSQASAEWGKRNPDYWRRYRLEHPEYVERNRAQQRERDGRRRERVLAKKNASTPETPMQSGLYKMIPVTGDDLAKMDAWTVRITAVTRPYAPSG